MGYALGILKATGIDSEGKEVEDVYLDTAGTPASIRLTPDKTTFNSDGRDLVYIVAEIVDKEGSLVPDAALPLNFEIKGNAYIKACGNANLSDTASYNTKSTSTWKGRAMTIVKAGDKKGGVDVTVHSPGLPSSTISMKGK